METTYLLLTILVEVGYSTNQAPHCTFNHPSYAHHGYRRDGKAPGVPLAKRDRIDITASRHTALCLVAMPKQSCSNSSW